MSMYDALNSTVSGYKMSGLDKMLTGEEATALTLAIHNREPDRIGPPEQGEIHTYDLATLDLPEHLRQSISDKLTVVRERAEAEQSMTALQRLGRFLSGG